MRPRGGASSRSLIASLIALGVAATAAAGVVALGDDGRRVEGHGVAIELPAGWEGRISASPGPSAPRLVAGTHLGRTLPPGGARLILLDYGAPAYPPPASLPAVRRADLTDEMTAIHTFV